jgi:dihydrofolate reductase
LTVSLIAAMANGRVIGKDGGLPWSVPEDMKFFMRTTSGHSVVMGRKTFESMNSKPLPKRRNIVVTRRGDYVATGAEVVTDIAAAIDLAKTSDPDPFVIGGAEIYRLALPLAQRVYLTTIDETIEGDTFFPELSAEWREVARRKGETPGVEFLTYEKVAS